MVNILRPKKNLKACILHVPGGIEPTNIHVLINTLNNCSLLIRRINLQFILMKAFLPGWGVKKVFDTENQLYLLVFEINLDYNCNFRRRGPLLSLFKLKYKIKIMTIKIRTINKGYISKQ